jgi:oxygen-independent coproporphyrinogen-3 oxidase
MRKTIEFTQREPIGSSTYPMPDNPVNSIKTHDLLDLPCPDVDKISTLYVHIPFCDQLCSFCGFNKYLSPEDKKAEYIDALMEEMRMYSQKKYVQTMEFHAIYLGGGTPNSLTTDQLERILTFIRANFQLSKDCEITCEGTPQNFTKEMNAALKKNGVNRISAGVQTFDRAIRLEHLHMRNGKEELLQYIDQIQTDFENFNLDLIYNLPNQTDEIWDDDLETVLKTKVKHLTIYPLVLLEKTAFYSDYVKNNKYPAPDQDREIILFNKTLKRLESSEFTGRYSVRDWAKPKYPCRYIHLNAEANQVLAFGAGAHGYVAGITYRNYKVLPNYGKAVLETKKLPQEAQCISDQNEIMQRYMVMGLRLLKRDMKAFNRRFNCNWQDIFGEKVKMIEDSGYITVNNDVIEFTHKGYIWANNVRTFFEGKKGTTVGYADTVSIGESGKDHYSSISRVKASADVEAVR